MPSRWCALLFVAVWCATASLPVHAGSAALGSVIGSLNAKIGEQALQPNTALFSGDSIQVRSGVAVVALEHGGRMTLGRDTNASFQLESQQVTLVLGRGIVSLFQEGNGAGLRVKAGEVSVNTGASKTAGTVARADGAVVVAAKRGILLVKSAGKVVRLIQGQTMVVRPGRAQGRSTYKLVGSNHALEAGAVGADAIAVIMGAVAASRVTTAHNTSVSASAGLDSATTAAGLANAVAVSAGCAINAAQAPNVPSPFVPPANASCP